MTLGRIAAATLSRIDTPPYSPDKSNVETSALLCPSLSFLSRASFAFPRLSFVAPSTGQLSFCLYSFISTRQIFQHTRSVLGTITNKNE